MAKSTCPQTNPDRAEQHHREAKQRPTGDGYSEKAPIDFGAVAAAAQQYLQYLDGRECLEYVVDAGAACGNLIGRKALQPQQTLRTQF